jgi:arabinofuranosyltransferase
VWSGIDSNGEVPYVLACLLLVAIYVWHALTVNYLSDDGFIALQYVKNWVRGDGPVYNPGERVEGYNNFLWLVLLACFHWLLPGMNLVHIARGLGIAFGGLTILLVCRFSRMIRKEPGPSSLLAGVFLAVHSGFAAWSTGGLETTMFAFLVFAGAYAYVSYLQTGRNFLAAPLAFALATLTRPDALWLFIITTVHATLWDRARGRTALFRRMLAWVAVFAAIYLPYYVWRFAYYGYPLPNTFYAKVGSGIYQYLRGANYLVSYLSWYGAFVFLPPLLLLLRKKREPWRDYFALLVGGYAVYLVYVGGDGLAFFRFLAYIAPLMYVLVQEGFADLYARASRSSFSPKGWKIAAPAALLVALALGFTMRQSISPLLVPTQLRWYEPQSELHFPGLGSDHSYSWFDNYFVDRLAVAARWLETNAPRDALIASTPAGSIAYHMNRKVIDMVGLNDVHIAHTTATAMGKGRAGHEKGDGTYVLSRAPDYILMGNVAVLPYCIDTAMMAEKLVLKSEHELWADPEFHRTYELECVRLADSGVFQYFTFFKKRRLALSAH